MSIIATTEGWPPLYKIRRHRRAKYVKLRTTKPHGLEITVPYRFNLREIPSILEENRIWITKQLVKFQSQYVDVLPDKVTLAAIGATWNINYVASNSKLQIIERPHHEIVLVGAVQDKQLCKDKLVAWVRALSKLHLPQLLNTVSEFTQLAYEKVTIRDQQTLWGSCTTRKSISLNYKLIFLPPKLVTHVMIHELCHTKYLNHSERFWNLVALHDGEWRAHKRELRGADKYIPAWV